jgi:hypothetical protein
MMRGKHKLMREGARGKAAVVGEQRRGPGTRDWRQYIDGRFEHPDGSSVTFTDYVLQADVGSDFLEVGDIVPVRYDADDHKRIVLDVPALLAEIAARQAGGEPSPDGETPGFAFSSAPSPATGGAPNPATGSAPSPATDGALSAFPRSAPGTAQPPLTPDEIAAALEQMAGLGALRHIGALGDDEYVAAKAALHELVRRRASGVISAAEFEAENALRLARLPASPAA